VQAQGDALEKLMKLSLLYYGGSAGMFLAVSVVDSRCNIGFPFLNVCFQNLLVR
jgi:hypothetical protein